MNEEGWIVDRQNGFPKTAQERLADMAVLLVDWGIADLTDANTARQMFADLRRQHREKQPVHVDDPTRDIFLSIREPDLKNAALYVDLDPEGRALTPSRLEDRDARVTIGALDYFLTAYSALPDVVSDEASWEYLVSDIRRRSPMP